MADNVNIIVQDTINDIVVNAAVVVETIDINVQAAVDDVQIIANPNNYVVNINRIIGEQVQSDWTQTDNQAPDYIKNKPTIPAAQVNSDWNATTGVAQILNKPTLATVATSGSYNDLINKPTIPAAQVNSDWDATSGVAEILNKPILAAVATSGNYEDLYNIPKNTSDFVNDGADGNNPFITAADIPPVTGFVPYDGATDNLDLGNNDLLVNEIFLYDEPNDNYGSIHYTDGDFHIEDADGHKLFVIEDGFMQLHLTDTIQSNLFTSSLTATRDHYLPNKSGTIALTSDITGTNSGVNTGDETTATIKSKLGITTLSGSNTGDQDLSGLTPNTRTISTTAPLSGGGDLSANRTLSITQASTSTDGFLSSTDWNTFNNKFTLPTLTSGSVLFSNGTTIAQDNSNLFWDDTNNRLGIGTTTPIARLHIAAQGALSTDIAFKIRNSANTADILNVNGLGMMEMINTIISLQLLNTTGVGIQFRNGAGSTSYTLRGWNTNTGVYTPLNIDANPLNLNTLSNSNVIFGSGNVLINTTTDAGFKLDVNGTARVSGTTTITPAALTGTAATSALDIAQTWNTTGTPSAIKLNITDTASNANSVLMDLQVGGVLQFKIDKVGNVTANSYSNKLNTPLLFVNTIAQNQLGILGDNTFKQRFYEGSTNNSTSGSTNFSGFLGGFTPTSGTGVWNLLQLNPTINQTGTASGITRGLYINPTLTSAADFRAIEVASGRVVISDTATVTGTNATSLLDLSQTWNTTGTPTAIKLNITNTASNASSNLIDLQVGGVSRFRVRQDGALTTFEAISGNSLSISTSTINYSYSHFLSNRATTATSGLTSIFASFNSFSPTSGTATFIGTNISPTINQTGGANGITRGLYINPTLTAAADFRAIETTRGRIVFGNLPTSSAGLPTGAVWNDAGTLKIV